MTSALQSTGSMLPNVRFAFPVHYQGGSRVVTAERKNMRPSGYLVTWDSRPNDTYEWQKHRQCCTTRNEADQAPYADDDRTQDVKNVLTQPLFLKARS